MKSYYDIAGDGGSRIGEQVAEQRARMVERLAGVRLRLSVGSGKGGVGKSTLTTLLATSLARRGRSVAIFDADLNGPSQARLAGLEPAPFVPGASGIALPRNADGVGVVSLGALVPEGQALEFDSVSQGEAHVWRAAREFTAVAELLGSVEWGSLDYLFFDLPPGAERTRQFAEFLGAETAFVLVTLPAALSRAVVARSLTALRATSSRMLGWVENMSGYYCADCGETKSLFPAEETIELDAPCLGRIPFDPRWTTDPAGAVTPTIDDLADRVARSLESRR